MDLGSLLSQELLQLLRVAQEVEPARLVSHPRLRSHRLIRHESVVHQDSLRTWAQQLQRLHVSPSRAHVVDCLGGGRGAYPCRFRQVSWWGFGGGSGVTETDENDRRLPLSAEVP